jgi:hypothetical protein
VTVSTPPGTHDTKGLHLQAFLTMEPTGLEPVTFWLPAKRSPS